MSAEIFGYADFGNLGPMTDRVMLVVMIVYMVVLSFALIYGALVYVLQSLGLHTIAKRRCIHHSWLAWVPVANMWVLGSISDQYQYVTKGKIRNRRKVLLGLLIGVYVFLTVFFVMLIAGVMGGEFSFDVPGSLAVAASLGGSVFFYLIAWALSMVALVFQYIVYYDLFASCNPNNAVVFLVLSIFFNFLLPFFVFASRKKDEGMPPRRVQSPPVMAQDPVYETVAEEPIAEETTIEQITEE